MLLGKCMHAACSQLYLTLCDSMDHSPPDFSVHGILQPRILEWVGMRFCRGRPDTGVNPTSLESSAGQVVSLPAEPSSEKPIAEYNHHQNQDIKVASTLQILWCILIIIPRSPKPLRTLWSVYSRSYFFPSGHMNGIRYFECSSFHLA